MNVPHSIPHNKIQYVNEPAYPCLKGSHNPKMTIWDSGLDGCVFVRVEHPVHEYRRIWGDPMAIYFAKDGTQVAAQWLVNKYKNRMFIKHAKKV